MNKASLLTIVGLLTLVSLAQAGDPLPPPRIVAYQPVTLDQISMEDQLGNKHQLGQLRGNVVVLLYGDRKSAEANNKLGEFLHVTFHPGACGLPPAQARTAPVRPLKGQAPDAPSPDVLTIPVAAIGNVPTLFRTFIRSQIRKSAPEIPVWLDFENTMSQRFGLTPAIPNLVVIDRAGRLRYGARGMLSKTELAQLASLIEDLRREPLPQP